MPQYTPIDKKTYSEMHKLRKERMLTCKTKGPLEIWNYTDLCAHTHGTWNEITMMCRGLVLETATRNIIARPFGKFFNYGEPLAAPLPTKDFIVSEKMDGSLGIGFTYEGEVHWATRGSLTSVQAKAAAEIWDKMQNPHDPLGHVIFPKHMTVCVEIIHPTSRVAVDYGDNQELVLLAAFDTSDGQHRELSEDDLQALGWVCGLRLAPRYNIADTQELLRMAGELPAQREGWVVSRVSDDGGEYPRVKIKGTAYCQVHRLIQGMNPGRLAELWRDDKLHYLDRLKDDHQAWIDEHLAPIEALYAERIALRDNYVAEVAHLGDNYREVVMYLQDHKCPVFNQVMNAVRGKKDNTKDEVAQHFGARQQVPPGAYDYWLREKEE